MSVETLDIASRSHKANAYATYERLRETSPVCRVMLPTKEPAWLLSRYSDVSALLKDRRFAKDAANARSAEELKRMRKPPKIFLPLRQNMLSMDDPDHARLKKLVQAGFTPKRVELLQTQTESIAEHLLDRLAGKSTFDLIAEYALPLPVTVISELLGVPHADRMSFARWSHTLLSSSVASWRALLGLPDMLRFLHYLGRLVEMKRAEPGEDLVSALVAIEEDGNRLNRDELLAMIAILLSAGHETTTNLIGNGTLALLQEPSALAEMRANARAGTVPDTAIEELLRFAGPIATSTFRYAREDVEIAGVIIPRGGLVLGIIASANRDEAQFPNANQLDLARTPNRHLTFGEGAHYCVGASLARMEGRVAFRALLRRMPDIQLNEPVETLRWRPGLVLRGLERLNVQRGESTTLR